MTATLEDRRAFATEVVSRLRGAGFRALFAGGCVRDLILGREPADFDVATDATPERVMGLFRRTVPVGVSFGVVRVQGPGRAGEVEVATFRSDGAYLDGRRPESVTFGTPELDAARRDFTINGMFLDPLSGEVIDYVGGRADLDAGILRAIGDPAARFAEDRLRLLRAARFAARFGFAIEPATRSALTCMVEGVRMVAAERIAMELRKMLVDPSRAARDGPRLRPRPDRRDPAPAPADEGPLPGQAAQPDGDLWDHTLLVLDHLGPEPSFPLAFAALFHDAGKPATHGLKAGRTTFYNHEHVGAKIVERSCRGLKLANAERDRVVWLVAFHQYLSDARALRESKLKRTAGRAGHRRAARPAPRRRPGLRRRRLPGRVLRGLPARAADRPDPARAPPDGPRPRAPRPPARPELQGDPRARLRRPAGRRPPQQEGGARMGRSAGRAGAVTRPLPRAFYGRDAEAVARDLLGKHLVRRQGDHARVGRVVEAEAYLGPHDLAAHSSKGRTPRTEVMFGPPGHAYVYLIYGMHHCLNAVTGAVGVASAVLIRALEPVEGIAASTKGPGLLCKAMDIDRSLNGEDLLGETLFFEEPPRHEPFRIVARPRIGVAYAGEWADKPLRFCIEGNAYLSRK